MLLRPAVPTTQLYVSRLHHSTKTEDIVEYMWVKTNWTLRVERLEARHNTNFKSFVVRVPTHHLMTFLKEEFCSKGKTVMLPRLPSIPGDEGVGEIVEMGKHVSCVALGDRVVLASRLLGSWRYYGVYNQRDVHVIARNLAIPEAAMLTVAPCSAYRLLNDFRKMKAGDTVAINAANSPLGQSVIQLCKARGINTFNIVASHCGYETVKAHLFHLGASTVHTLEEAEALTTFDTSLARPTLALNCLGGRYEDVMLKLLARNGVIVYYGNAYFLPTTKQFFRCDVDFYKFNMQHWEACATPIEKDVMYKKIIQLMIVGDFIAPTHVPIEMDNYVLALRNTVHSEAFSTFNYVFDFTLPCC